MGSCAAKKHEMYFYEVYAAVKAAVDHKQDELTDLKARIAAEQTRKQPLLQEYIDKKDLTESDKGRAQKLYQSAKVANDDKQKKEIAALQADLKNSTEKFLPGIARSIEQTRAICKNHDQLNTTLDKHRVDIVAATKFDNIQNAVADLAIHVKREEKFARDYNAVAAETQSAVDKITLDNRQHNDRIQKDISEIKAQTSALKKKNEEYMQWKNTIKQQKATLREEIARYDDIRSRKYKVEIALSGKTEDELHEKPEYSTTSIARHTITNK
eukprot:gnl/Spiro4/16030_TR8620_c0_g1_i1.p2 gnl/Spiro4/16030_TR8620_c0_g1~~gnl/Spiro4/16030_TR8620_c0_g1_i1.p2  ORF type:complete len:270 (+),score=84.30 gnl/Spiro4/16030_TR8620_c0_g1_i1:63-872(+)